MIIILLAVEGRLRPVAPLDYTGNLIADTIEDLPPQASKPLNRPQVKTLVAGKTPPLAAQLENMGSRHNLLDFQKR
jgi:hypothetical protein